MTDPFVIGGRCRNRDGPYEVVSIKGERMVIRYEDGRELSTTVAMQRRIWENIQLDEEIESKKSTHVAVLPTFLIKKIVYKPTDTPSPLLDQLEHEEVRRVQQFWESHQIHWDAESQQLTASGESALELNRPLFDQTEAQNSNVPRAMQAAINEALKSESLALIVWAVIYAGHAVFRFGGSLPPVKLYVQAMQRIARYLLQKPMLLSRCMERAIKECGDGGVLSTFIADELVGLYLRACLLSGDGLFISHIDGGKIILGYLDSLDLARLRTIAFHCAWVLASRIPVQTLNLLAPDHNEGEKWVSQGYLYRKQGEANALRQGRGIPWPRLDALTKSCWQEIRQTRRYGVPSHGRAEALIDHELLTTLGLNSIRFVQEGIKPPGVYIRFHFDEPPWQVGIVRVTSEGEVEGFHEQQRGLLNAAVRGIALTYYRDFVTPGEEVLYEPTGIRRKPRPPGLPKPHKRRTLPRRQRIRVGPGVVDFDKWTQERARHSVVGHTRWISPGFVASREKQQDARDAGVWRIPEGYTWVVEHERGGLDSGQPGIRRGDLTRRTLFSAPARASDDLVKILL